MALWLRRQRDHGREWDQFTGIIPEAERHGDLAPITNRLTSDDEATRLEAAREWSLWEGHVATLLPNEDLLESFGDPAKLAVPFARICAKFFLENFFLEENVSC